MSRIGGPIQAGLAGIVQASEATARSQAARERQKAEAARRFADEVDLTIAGVEGPEAPKPIDEREPKGRHDERKGKEPKEENDDSDRPHLDVTG